MAVLTLGLPAGALAVSCSTGQQTFVVTGSEQCYLVPSGVSALRVVAVGGAGGSTFIGVGGRGARVTGDIGVTPGQTLFVEVDVGAGSGATGGGGESDVRTCSVSASCPALGTPQDPRLIVAGGGGGGGLGGGAGNGGDAGIGAGGASDTCKAASDGTAGNFTSGTDGGGGGGGCEAGGAGGAAGGVAGTNGTAGAGGTGGGGNGGGGGGGGYFGGGGGAGSGGGTGSGGGGGGGASYGPEGSVFVAALGGTQPSVAITPLVATLSVGAPGSVAFPGTQPQATLSAPQTVTITDIGTAPLAISSLTFTGADRQDFLISSNGCMGQIAASASCTLGVSFAPQAQGSRSAILQIASNDPGSPASVPVSGTGGRLPQGPSGQTGATGATGPRGPQGPAGKIELVVCTTVTKTITKGTGRRRHKVKVTQQKCTTKLVSGTVKFTTGSANIRATVSRVGVVYATGLALSIGAGRWQLVLKDRRTLRPGRYTLTLRSRHNGRWVIDRRSITVT